MSIKSILAIWMLAFFFTACSHSPINPEHINQPNFSKIISVDSAQKPDLIIPPLNDTTLALTNEEIEKNNLVWERISDHFKLTDFYNHPRVLKQKDKYLRKSEYISIVSKRSEPFIHFVLTEIEKRQMPTELAILPIVESGYYPRARSRAKAEGLWQIMPYTGKELGLKRTYSYDGRHDVYASTSAALDYLSQMHKRFDGDWLLALAAYNAGPHRIKRALKYSNHTHGENPYWNLRLPLETREYIPKILALCSIVKNKKLRNSLLYPIANESYLEPIQLSKRISPAKLARQANVSESELKLLNPALRNFTIPIHVGYQLLVPKEDANVLSLTIEKMPEDTQPVYAQHKINRGESLSGIALRYGTSVSALREANNLYSNTIVAGRSLYVPSEAGAKIKTAPTPRKKQSEEAPPQTTISGPYMYVVALGDSFWKIANRNNTTVQRLFEINGRSADQPLLPGETILVD